MEKKVYILYVKVKGINQQQQTSNEDKIMNIGSIYVGTYSKYANGCLDGAWLNLDDFVDFDDFERKCKEIHRDEQDPEFMIQDYEAGYLINKRNYQESGISWIEEIFEIAENFRNTSIEEGAFYAFYEAFDHFPEDENEFYDKYLGEFSSYSDLGYFLIYELGCWDVPEILKNFIDYEKYGREASWDFHEIDNYYFWN